ncbi:MAG: Na+-dependent transporter [Steroidobacteraceae bacterium]
MTLAELAPLAIKISIVLLVFSFGLTARWADETSLFRRLGLLLRSVLAMNVVMFSLAVTVTLLFDLHPALEIGLVALSLSPVPPAIPGKLLKAGSTLSVAVGLVTAMSVLAIVIVPLGVELAGKLVGKDLGMPIRTVAAAVLIAVILPLSIGVAVRRYAPRLAERVSGPLHIAAIVLLVLALVPLLIMVWPLMSSMLGTKTLPMLALFSVTGLVVGHVLAGPNEAYRTVLALATSTRHPGMALAMAGMNFPEAKGVLAVVICHVVVSGIVVVPYVMWRKRVQRRPAEATLAHT